MIRAALLLIALAIPGRAALVDKPGPGGVPSIPGISVPASVPGTGAVLPTDLSKGPVQGTDAVPTVPGIDAVPELPKAAVPAAAPVKMDRQTGKPVPAKDAKAAKQQPAAQLAALATEASAAPAQGSGLGGSGFDGSDGKKGGATGVPFFAPTAIQAEDIRFTRDEKKKLKASATFTTIRVVKTRGQQWHWGKYKAGTLVRILVGGQTMFVSKVESGQTKKIERVTKADLAGYYSAQYLRGKSIDQLRRRLIADLRKFSSFSGPAGVITQRSEVRVVRFMPYGEARKLPENAIEPVLEARPRTPVSVPADLADLHHYLPKAVLIDMRLYQGRVPFEQLEDIGKLMKAGVYIVMLTDKKREGPDSLEDMLTGGLTNRERDQFVRHKLIALTDDGTSLAAFQGNFPRTMPAPRFTDMDREIMAFEAQRRGAEIRVDRGYEVSFALKPGEDGAEFAKTYALALSQYEIPLDRFKLRLSQDGGRTVVTLRPGDLASAIPHLLEALRDHQGLYANMSDLMVVSRDQALLEATKGSVQPSALTADAGPELAEVSLAALLGPYRDNLPGDLAASASKITSFMIDKDRVGGAFYNVYMLMGHVMHSSFNWAVWQYRNTGVFPTIEALVEQANKTWDHEDAGRTKNMVENPGETMEGYREAMVARLRTMHRATASLLKKYPIVVGTELPNLFIFDRYKGTQFLYRDILRLIYDFVIARETPKGTEVVIVDFKTGQTSTLQNMEKDVQVRLYDHVVRAAWENLPLPYGGTGSRSKVSATKVTFIFTKAAYEPSIHEWNRIDFEKQLRLVMNRMRRHSQIPIPDGKPPKAPKAAAPAKKSPAKKKASAKKKR